MKEFFEVERPNDALFLRLTRDVVATEHAAMVAELEAIISKAALPSKLLIDLSSLSFASAVVIGTLLRVRQRVGENDGLLRLRLHAKVQEMFVVCDLDRVFDIFPTTDKRFHDRE